MEVVLHINHHYVQAEYIPPTRAKDATHRSPYNNELYKVTGDKIESWLGAYGWVKLADSIYQEALDDIAPLTGNPRNRYNGSSIDDFEVKYYESIETKNLYKFDDMDNEVLFSKYGKWINSTFEVEELCDTTLFKRLNLNK